MHSMSVVSFIPFYISSTIDVGEILRFIILSWFSNNPMIASLGSLSSNVFILMRYYGWDFYQKCFGCYSQAAVNVVKG